jgi:hypothetical protein
VNWAYFPRSARPTRHVLDVVDVFTAAEASIDSQVHTHHSDAVLAAIRPGLLTLGFTVETGKKKSEKIEVPVLYGNNGKLAKVFDADAYHTDAGFVLEVEAGRATANNQFLKDLFQACMMDGVDYLCIAVRNVYEAGGVKNRDFEIVVTFFETLYASNRLKLPLQGILVIGY